jgi:nucleotide-binding universal stress UspA family protein
LTFGGQRRELTAIKAASPDWLFVAARLPAEENSMANEKQAATKSIKDILAVVDLAGERNSAKLAADLARRIGSHLTGLALAYDPITPAYSMAAPIPTDFMVTAREQALADAKKAATAFEEIGRVAGIPVETRVSDIMVGDGFGGIIDHCKLTDLVVVGQDNPDQREPLREVLTEAVMFQAAVPTLLVPHAGPSEFTGNHAIVAWNGGTTAARAVRAALPLLRLGKKVTAVMIDDGRRRPDIPGADIGTYLARHDLDVTVRTIARSPTGIAQTLLDFAADEGADWLVMGAYGHSRLREFILGGTTARILKAMNIPVFMAHS